MGLETNVHGIIVPDFKTLYEYKVNYNPSSVITGLRETGKRMKKWGVEAVVAANTHWQTGDKFFIDNSSFHKTVMNYHGFHREIENDVPGHPELAGILQEAGERNLVFPVAQKHGADNAITIPLHFMFPENDVPVVPLSIAGTTLCAFRWGRILGKALRNWGGKVLFLASAYTSHDLDYFMRNFLLNEHEEFDRQVLKMLSGKKGIDVPSTNPKFEVSRPKENLRYLFMLLGVIGSQSRWEVRAYKELSGVEMSIIEFLGSDYDERDNTLLNSCHHDVLIN